MFTWTPPDASANERFVVINHHELHEYQRRGWRLVSLFQETHVASASSYAFHQTTSGNSYGNEIQYVDVYDGHGNRRSETVRCPAGTVALPAINTHTVVVTLALMANETSAVNAFDELTTQHNVLKIKYGELETELKALKTIATSKEEEHKKHTDDTKRAHDSVVQQLNYKVRTALGIEIAGLDTAVTKMWSAVTGLKPEGAPFEAFRVTMSSGDWGTAFQIASAVAVRPSV